MRTRSFSLFVSLPLALLSLGLQAAEPAASEAAANPVVATINGIAIHKDKFDRWSLARLQGKKPQNAQQEKTMLDALIARELVILQALKEGLGDDPQLLRELAEQKNTLLASHWTQKWLEKNVVGEAELQAEYDRRVASTAMAEYKARQILLESEQDAKNAIDELGRGTDFATLAQGISQDPSGKDGGSLGWFSATSDMAAIVGAIQNIEKGSYTKTPVETKHGWHVVLLEDSRKTPVPTFEQAKGRLSLGVQKRRFQEYLAKLKKEATIVVNK